MKKMFFYFFLGFIVSFVYSQDKSEIYKEYGYNVKKYLDDILSNRDLLITILEKDVYKIFGNNPYDGKIFFEIFNKQITSAFKDPQELLKNEINELGIILNMKINIYSNHY